MFSKIKKIQNILKIIFVFVIILGPLNAIAADTGLSETAGAAGIQKFDIATKIGDIISIILGFVGILFLILTIAGGLMWMTAGGSEEKLGKAKKLITSAVVGMIIVFSAYAITYFITETLLGR